MGKNKEFLRQYLAGELEVELAQGTLAERLRAGGGGEAAFFTTTGVGTQVAEGGLPWRYADYESVARASTPRQVRVFGRSSSMERAITCDFGLVRASKGDTHGNLVFDKSARKFNPLAAMAGQVNIAEVDELVEPDAIHTPEMSGPRVVALIPEQAADKRIEKRTWR